MKYFEFGGANPKLTVLFHDRGVVFVGEHRKQFSGRVEGLQK